MAPGRGERPTSTKPLPQKPGNTHRPFADLIALEKINDKTFRSIAPAFSPGGPIGTGRSYGAHVYMQAAWAASQTVAPGFLLHHISGNFIRAGELNIPFVYKVDNIRDGRSYCTRIVNVTQTKGINFTCICSFKTPEHRQVESQDDVDIEKKYSSVWDEGKRPSDFPEVPVVDPPSYSKSETGINDAFPGLETRKVDMAAYNNDRHPLDRRQLIFYRTTGDMPDDPNMHLCAHLYASDRKSLYTMANHFELEDRFSSMSSLSHTVIFHSPAEALLFGGSSADGVLDDKTGRWFTLEISVSRMGSGRAVHNCRIWNSENEHVATTMQDGLIRYAANPQKPTDDELKIMESSSKKWSGPKREEKL